MNSLREEPTMSSQRPDRPRRLVLAGAVSVALISTGSAYLAMVAFGIDVLVMSPGVAYTTAGVFELSLVTVALLAREAAKENRPGGTLLMLTWVLSGASGLFAGWHELYIDHPFGAAIFRFLVPLLAALMWHLALIGDRHLATGRTWSSMRESARMHALFLTIDAERRARRANDGRRKSARRIARAQRRRLRARAVALRTVPPAAMRAQITTWSDALAAVDEGVAEAVTLADNDTRRMDEVLHRTVQANEEEERDSDRGAIETTSGLLVLGTVRAPHEDGTGNVPGGRSEDGAAVQVSTSGVSGRMDGHPRTANVVSDEELLIMREQGMSFRKIAGQVGLAHSTVEARIKRRRIGSDVRVPLAAREVMAARA